jgi:hypothetical protein
MTKISFLKLPRNAYIHIDKICVTGPCRHKPIGKVFYDHNEEVGPVAMGARPRSKQLKTGAEEAFMQSKDIQDDGFAYKFEIHCCPPKVLQKHNVFGHSSILSYIYAVFDHAMRALGIEADPEDREEWRKGCVWLTEVHLTGNFGCHAQHIVPIIDAVDENNAEGKLRALKTCITLGCTGKRRSKYDMLTLYGKKEQLVSEWKRPGLFQKNLIQAVTDSIRGEIKLYSMGLKDRKLQYAANWRDVDVASLFFEIFATYKVVYAIQPLLTEDELATLNKAELRVYRRWLSGEDLKDQFSSRTSAWKYTKSIKEKTGMDISGQRRPEALSKIHLGEIFCPDNLLPIPDWLFGTEHYCPPNQPDLPRRRFAPGIGKVPLDS